MTRVSLTTPLSNEVVANLRIGQQVSISGVIYTARDAAHKRLVELLDKGAELPIDLNGQIIYYVGPAPAPPGRVIGSAGPTTAGRMDAYAPRLIAKGLKGMIGKGARSEAVIESMKKYKAVYFAAIGGAAALISKCIVEAEVVAYPELGPEAIYRMVVKDFPAIVVNDAFGGDLYQEGRKLYAGE
ncbi:hydro-lyase, Fe-S type, tartrate/fumarate subfamily, beta subunit [Desulfotomaculum nigrificans CO-1-SRB]|uniref:Hydro-lyase, Fe-S type, tartrate/fumarate subfamily, beta subunit n=1 Tax=Desulfotomaculum nigrificans (strain DSM 14880 / VKM B-2319 / CO-1-SRB) TaxID=868595 RepID=F6B5C7_DESCC|nr:Fe-S-containing hydro-lyase [Desulfotomaculum nigrificans]AEF94248.1 hydro-lyase, Fe-S type, tartrate/fumarate subfamily, beta subunit [Desulfotomaculum nigrificans CO-1-SRB]